MNGEMTFENLTEHVKTVHEATSAYAKGAVNQLLTVRNWAIGRYIVEYEQGGKDRARYGSHLLQDLADRLQVKGLDRTHLNLCRIFYQKYPQICATVSHRLQGMGNVREWAALPRKENCLPEKYARQCRANSRRLPKCLSAAFLFRISAK